VKLDENEPCSAVVSSFRSVRGSKWKPNLPEHEVPQNVKREMV